MNKHTSKRWRTRSGFYLLACATPLAAQLGYAQDNDTEDEVFTLSPFEVTADDSTGYKANASLAGTRIKTDIRDISAPLSIMTKEFLRDTNATDNQSLLTYTTNTEVGGVLGNYSGVGNTFIDGVGEAGLFVAPNNNTRVRGLDSADNTRDYFQSDIPWDSYNVERVELQRGPNSILFGIGSPAGIINTGINRANFSNGGSIDLGFGSFGSTRLSFDYNKTFIEDELAVRVAALHENTKFRQKPAFEDDDRIYLSLRYKPKFLQTDSVSTVIRAGLEHGDIQANRPRVLPPEDRISTFFDSSAINRQTWDPFYAWEAGIIGYERDTIEGETKNLWTVQYPGPGLQATSNPVFVYGSGDSSSPLSARQASPSTNWGINATGGLDAGIGGFPYGSNIGIGGYGEFARNSWTANPDSFPAADKGFYKAKAMTDDSIFDFYNQLIDGPNKSEWQEWKAYNVSLEQTFFNNKLGYEIVLDQQDYNDGGTRNSNGSYITVDIRENLMVYPWAYGASVVANPNAGRAFIGSGSKGTSSAKYTDRKNERATAFYDLDLADAMGDNLLGRMLGRHTFNGVYSKETYSVDNRDWVRYAVEPSWSDAYGNANGGLNNGDVVLDWITYLSDDLRGRSSASGLNLSGINVVQSPSGSMNIPYFDSTWNSSVSPGAEWINPVVINGNSQVSTQSENPFNYVGWTNRNWNILNADTGDIDQLYTGVAVRETEITSEGITWQGKLFGGTVVPTWGYRKDKLVADSGSSTAAFSEDGIAKLNPALSGVTFRNEGSSTSWGVVVHTPKDLADKLPWGTSVSLTYNRGRNTRVESRYGFAGDSLPNSTGESEDYGFVISTLDDKLVFKTTFYETKNFDANIAAISSETTTLGSNTYYLRNLEAWGIASALTDLAGREVAANPDAYTDAERGVLGWNWYWNWALVDGNSAAGAESFPGAWDGAYNDVNSTNFTTHPSTIKQTAAINSWLEQMPDQDWFDAYGFNVDVAKARAGDWQGAIGGWNPTAGVGGVQPAGGGRVNGVWPTGTVDYVSKGVEFELIGNLSDNWTVSANVSKTKATQTALGAELVEFIEDAYAKYQSPAGDLRLWWGGDNTVRQYFVQNIWSAYQFQLQTNGKMTPELSPWRFNLVTNYSFNDGAFKGLNVGMGYRWQDKKILGYYLNDAEDNLDVNRPIWSKDENHLDLWAGKDIQLSDSIKWRIQLNLRNVGESPGLRQISVQPDGSPAGYAIQEGATWQLTNTFSF